MNRGMKTLDKTPTLFDPAKAEAVAKELGASDPDWDYVVRHAPNGAGLSSIDIYDEDGELVGKF